MLRNRKIFKEIRFKINILFFFYLDSMQISFKKLLRMKKINILYLILTIFITASCGEEGGDDATPNPNPTDPLDVQAELLNGTWTVKASSVTKDGTIVDVFNNMTLTLSGATKSGGNFSTSHNEDSGTEVWPNSGSWTFQNGDKNKLQRNDGVVVSISATETTLRTSFSVSGGIKDGNWVFEFTK